MTEQIAEAMSAPDVNGRPSLPRRNAPKMLMPGSWISRSIRAEYRDGDGQGQTMSGKCLDYFPTGLVIGSSGARVLLSWDSLILVELVE